MYIWLVTRTGTPVYDDREAHIIGYDDITRFIHVGDEDSVLQFAEDAESYSGVKKICDLYEALDFMQMVREYGRLARTGAIELGADRIVIWLEHWIHDDLNARAYHQGD